MGNTCCVRDTTIDKPIAPLELTPIIPREDEFEFKRQHSAIKI